MKQLQATVAALIILAMVLCLYVIVHAGNVINEAAGPSWLAAGSDARLYVASHGSIHVFSREGRRELSVALDPLGVTRTPSDMALRSDGKLLVADSRPRLAVCDLARRQCDGRDLALARWTPEFLMPGNAFKFALDEKRDRMYISDNAGHGLVIMDGSGKFIARTPPGSRIVLYPNQILADVPGEITLADTNHHRVVTFDVSQDRIGKVLRQFPVDAPGLARPGREWPFGIARTGDGGLWVAVARDGMKDADLILYSGEGKARKRLDLGEASDPWAIAAWNGRIAMADARNYRLLTFRPDGSDVREIADPAFEGELGELREHVLDWKYYRLAAFAGMVGFPVLGIFALWRMGVPLVPPARAPIARPAAQAPRPPPGKEIRWVDADPAAVAKLRRMMRVLLLVMIVAGASLTGLQVLVRSSAASARHPMVAIGLLVAFGVVLAIALMKAVSQMGRIRVGASAQGLHIVAPPRLGGAIEARGPVPWSDVYFDGRRMLIGRTLIMAKSPSGYELFAREPFEREILSRIPAANFLSTVALSFKATASSGPVMKVAYALLIVATIVVAALAVALLANRP